MFFLQQAPVPPADLDRAIYALLQGRHGWERSSQEARQERIRRAKHYESYATRCLRAAFPDRLPLDSAGNRKSAPPLTDELIERAASALFDYRGELLYSELKRECAWMLQGYLGIPLEHRRGWNEEGLDVRSSPSSAGGERLDIKLLLLEAELAAQRSYEQAMAEHPEAFKS